MALSLDAKELFTVNILQYEVSDTKCAIDDKIVSYITAKAGYKCAVFKGRISMNLGEKEEIPVQDFLQKEIFVTIQGKRGMTIDARVRIPGEMDAVFSPVLGGSFVVGYDSDKTKKKGVMFLIYIV